MNYDQLKKMISGRCDTGQKKDPVMAKLLSPRPLETPEELETIISTRFRYTGPGKWVKILKESAEK